MRIGIDGCAFWQAKQPSPLSSRTHDVAVRVELPQPVSIYYNSFAGVTPVSIRADIQTTTVYTRLTQSDLQKVISEFDRNGDGKKDSHPAPHGT